MTVKLVQPGTETECSKELIDCSMYTIAHLNEHALFSSSKRHQHTTWLDQVINQLSM